MQRITRGRQLLFEVGALIFPADNHTDRTRNYPLEDGFNFDGIDAPSPINQIKRVEKLNKMAVNVFGYKNNAIAPYRQRAAS